jgi:hypothetical protein
MNRFFCCIIVFIFISCSKEIEIKIPDQKPAIVVYSTIVPFTLPQPKSLSIEIKKTAHIFDTSNYIVENALVKLFKNNTLIDTIKYSPSTKIYPLNITPKAYENYSVIIETDHSRPLKAITTIPEKVQIIDTTVTPIAYFDETGSVFSEVNITFKDPGNSKNFYELALSDIAFSYDNPDRFYEISTNDNIITSESYYPSLIRFDVNKPKYLLFTDDAINGREHTVNIYYTPPQKIREDDNRYISNHYITIHLRNVTEEYYKFKTTLIQQSYNKQEDILYGMGEPLNIYSNIENGYGLFTGFNNDMLSIKIDEVVINK